MKKKRNLITTLSSTVSAGGSLRHPSEAFFSQRGFPLTLHLDSNWWRLNDLHKPKGLSTDASATQSLNSLPLYTESLLVPAIDSRPSRWSRNVHIQPCFYCKDWIWRWKWIPLKGPHLPTWITWTIHIAVSIFSSNVYWWTSAAHGGFRGESCKSEDRITWISLL